MTSIKGKYEFKTEKEGGPVFASDVLRESIGLDLSSKLNGGRSSHSHPEELELVSPSIKRKIKTNIDEIGVFILDESSSSKYENMITLGIMEEPSVTVSTSSTKSQINWRVLEVI